MTNRKIYTLIAAIATVTGLSYIKSSHRNTPSDLKDAVAGDFDTTIPPTNADTPTPKAKGGPLSVARWLIPSTDADIPTPKAVAVEKEGSTYIDDAVNILESAMRCRANGLPPTSCHPDLTGRYLDINSQLYLQQEIERCNYLDVNLPYCLTTANHNTAIDTVIAYAARARKQGIPLRTALLLDKEPVKNDRVGIIESLLRCEAMKLGFEACGLRRP